MVLIAVLAFLFLQFLINVLLSHIRNDRLTYIFASLAPIGFTLLMFLSPNVLFLISELIQPDLTDTTGKCLMMDFIGMIIILMIGCPLAYLFQVILNRRMHHLLALLAKYEGK